MRALTPAYASPEMLENEDPDPRDDVYALACVAWKLMTGELPFKAKDPSAARNVAQLACPPELSRREFRALCHALAIRAREAHAVGAAVSPRVQRWR